MTINALSRQSSIRPASISEETAKEAQAIAELLMLEQCMQSCDTLASQLTGAGVHEGLRSQLGECTAACQAYLAVKVREIVDERRYATRCVEKLNETAARCRSLGGERAKHCQRACEIGIAFLNHRPENTLASRN